MDKEKIRKKIPKNELIIKSALKVFCEKGYDGTTIDDIVHKAGCSHGLFYHYYKSKKQVFDEVINARNISSTERLREELKAIKGFREKLRTLINHVIADYTRDENNAYYFYFFLSRCFAMRENGEIFPPPKDNSPFPLLEILHEVFTEGQKSGECIDSYSVAECIQILIYIISGTALSFVITPKDFQTCIPVPNVDFILDIFTQGATRK